MVFRINWLQMRHLLMNKSRQDGKYLLSRILKKVTGNGIGVEVVLFVCPIPE